MTLDTYTLELLRSIRAHEAKWSWYQLDRMLGAQGLLAPRPLMTLLRELEQHGLIASSPGHTPAQPVYSLTSRGHEQLEAEEGAAKG